MQKDAAYANGVPPYVFIGLPQKKGPVACALKQSLISSLGKRLCASLISLHRAASWLLTASTWNKFSPTKSPPLAHSFRCGCAINSGHTSKMLQHRSTAASVLATSRPSTELAPDQSGSRITARSRGSRAMARKSSLRTINSGPSSDSVPFVAAASAPLTTVKTDGFAVTRGLSHVTFG